MPSVSPATFWNCGYCNVDHRIISGSRPSVLCPTLNLRVYSASALVKGPGLVRDWTLEHEFVQSVDGEVFCSVCLKAYEDLQAEEEARLAQ